MTPPPVALTIAGSDSGGGAGIQADLKTFEAHGVFGTSAITLITAQNTLGVRGVEYVSPGMLRAQIRAVLDDFPVAAVKTGALGRPELVQVVAEELRGAGLPLVVDPVMLAKSGDALLDAAAVRTLLDELFPLATLITPNRPEWDVLREAGAAHSLPLLLKGGHAPTGDLPTGDATVTDELRTPAHSLRLSAPRLHTRHTHGTGCTLSAAITANLARGLALPQAVAQAHAYLQAALRRAPGLGAGQGPLGFRSGP
ncbi:bifunctional hydroxymethylpyrimidine kinase/phosphomethylpyrimidine kinase [Deinococcus sp.]|uniref:bifunctional hydroxymethylpyrimidine kinase/phosphomethylpyrimidine kinase n=1 Tax=Deinococcus sp. TaxID=47478 RepID=UPI0025BA4E1B|nr:bifunctional hydroxymethylpyrimidine kinase/phosphomethylpyrimidine kinase [Deinococcus sp.]